MPIGVRPYEIKAYNDLERLRKYTLTHQDLKFGVSALVCLCYFHRLSSAGIHEIGNGRMKGKGRRCVGNIMVGREDNKLLARERRDRDRGRQAM